ncbi:HAD-IA family hydrolase [Streptomyces sp. K1PN6]|uniref:HAD-IA family hydrolase n=1 Tax=Streptomyces acidicola TaxID=2596892 RepID=A0A5N8WWU0_9ACTN|nr:HAD-IA family hydrolase [Streptomyces acidicola]
MARSGSSSHSVTHRSRSPGATRRSTGSSRRDITVPGLNAHAGLGFQQALSSETVLACKPAPEVYQLAIDTAGCPPERVLMVAAHAWGLRGAQATGMRTAYVQRPVGDPPASSDVFDWRFDGLGELITALTVR